MKTPEKYVAIGISMLFVLGLTACDKPGPAESAGKKVDQTVTDAGKQISDQSDRAVVAIDDAEITTKIKAAILAEPGLKTLQISVETIKGVVQLTGSADSVANSEMAQALAGAVTGVTSVKNQLVIKPIK